MPCNIQVLNAPTEGNKESWELAHARRNLALIKSKLDHEAVGQLFKDEFAASTAWWVSQVKASGDRPRQYFSITIHVQNLSIENFFAWWKQAPEADLLGGEPDHWAQTYNKEHNSFRVREFVGGAHLSQIFMRIMPLEKLSQNAQANALDGWPVKLTGVANFVGFEVQEVHAEVLHQFRPTQNGFEAKMGGLLPAAVPEEIIEGQRRHLVVEWTNWFSVAAEWAAGNKTA